MTTDDELLTLARAATPGPWEAIHCSWETSEIESPGRKTIAQVHIDPEVTEDTQYDLEPIKEANAAYIAAASPERIIALVERLQDAESLLFDIAHDPNPGWATEAANDYFAAHETPPDAALKETSNDPA